jgi:uncharacterized protein YjbJ (UPF0337 family)
MANQNDRNDQKDLNEQGMEDSLRGKAEHAKGRLKDAAGGLTGDSSMQAEGKWDQAKGKLRDKLGKAERDLGSD